MDGNLGRLIVHFGGDLTLLRQSMGEFDKIIGNASKTGLDKMKAVGGAIQAMGMKMTVAVTAPIVAMGAAAIKQASDYQEYLNRVQVALKESSALVTNYTKISRKEVGIANVSAMEMASGFADMATSLGLSTEEAADLSKTLVQLAGDMVSFKNVRRDIVTTALTGIFTGETESLKRLGVIMTEQAIEAWMLAKGIKSLWKDMGQASRVMMRYAYVMDVQQNSMGDFQRTINNTANQMRLFEESIKELGVSVGEVFRQQVTNVIKIINRWIDAFISADDATKRMVVIIAAIAAGIGPALVIIGFSITQITTVFQLFAKIKWAAIGKAVGDAFFAIRTAILATTAPTVAVLGTFALIIAAITTFIIVAHKQRNAQQEITQSQKEYAAATAKLQRPLLEERQNLRILINLAKEYKSGSDERIAVIKKIKAEYPGYLDGLRDEQVLTEDLDKAWMKAVDDYEGLLTLKALEAKRGVAKEKELGVEEELIDLIGKRIEAEIALEKQRKELQQFKDDVASGNARNYYMKQYVESVDIAKEKVTNLSKAISMALQRQKEWGKEVMSWEKAYQEQQAKLQTSVPYKNKIQAQIDAEMAAKKKADEETRIALGIIGRLQADIDAEHKLWVASNTKDEMIMHAAREASLQKQLDLLLHQYKVMQKMKPKESGYEGSLKRINGGYQIANIPEVPNIAMQYLNPEQYKKEWDEWVQYQQSLIRKDLQNPKERTNTIGLQEELEFWDDYYFKMQEMVDINQRFGDDGGKYYDLVAEKISYLNSKLEIAKRLFGTTSDEVIELENTIKGLGPTEVDVVTESMSRLKEEAQMVTESMSRLKEEAQLVSSTITQAFDLMAEALLDNLGEAKTGFDRFIQALYGSAVKGIGSMLGMAIANAVYSGTEAGKASGAAAPFTTPAFIAELVGIVMSAFAAIPAFADGGIVSGPTMALMGEYPGAKSNPEVIMPLNKLQSYLGNQGDVRVYGKLVGEDIYVSSQRFDKRKTLLQ